ISPPRANVTVAVQPERRPRLRPVLSTAAILALIAVAYAAAVRSGIDVRSILSLTESYAAPDATASAPVARDVALALPRRGEITLVRARALMDGGHFHEALTALDTIRATDPQRADADRLRADIQRQLLALAHLPGDPAQALAAREKGERRV